MVYAFGRCNQMITMVGRPECDTSYLISSRSPAGSCALRLSRSAAILGAAAHTPLNPRGTNPIGDALFALKRYVVRWWPYSGFLTLRHNEWIAGDP